MGSNSGSDRPRYRALGRRHIGQIQQLDALSRDQLIALKAASTVLPFRVNGYVLDELIDWSDIPSDPIYQLTFPQAAMLDRADYLRLRGLLMSGADPEAVQHVAREIQMGMNPHPAGPLFSSSRAPNRVCAGGPPQGEGRRRGGALPGASDSSRQ